MRATLVQMTSVEASGTPTGVCAHLAVRAAFRVTREFAEFMGLGAATTVTAGAGGAEGPEADS